MNRKNFFAIGLIIIGAIYHSNGMNDWLSPNTVHGDITLVEATNEIIASISITGGIILLGLPAYKKED